MSAGALELPADYHTLANAARAVVPGAAPRPESHPEWVTRIHPPWSQSNLPLHLTFGQVSEYDVVGF
jgi:hypothetical protein